jgi:hypothetical protein
MRHKVAMLGLLAAPVATAGQTHAAFLDQTRFLLHVGTGFYAFHHFVWARYKNGGFSASDPHRKSNSNTLHVLVAPLNKLGGAVNTVYTRLKGGQHSDTDIQSLNDNVSSFGNLSGSNGVAIKD